MGGLWVDYNLMSNLPGLFVIGEANFSDHGANRLGASALMQGLADGYFILPLTVGSYLGVGGLTAVAAGDPELARATARVAERTTRLLSIKGRRSVTSFHRELGQILWDGCGMVRSRPGLLCTIEKIAGLRERFYADVAVPGSGAELNLELEHAGRTADFLDLAELMCQDALRREESCGCHFRQEHQTALGEARRDDAGFAHVAAWTYAGPNKPPLFSAEPLVFENATLVERNYH
jgi:succinate dehydrogenase / fumarate reductase flavoprotein subunit